MVGKKGVLYSLAINIKLPDEVFADIFLTPIGEMIVCATPEGICLLEFLEGNLSMSNLQIYKKWLPGVVVKGENDHIVQLKQELKEYFAGNRVQFDVALHLFGTDFQLM